MKLVRCLVVLLATKSSWVIKMTATSDLTTATLLLLEEVGAILSGGMEPNGLTLQHSLEEWQTSMPMVNPSLVKEWYLFSQAKYRLESIIQELKESI